jgi:hypothetical protein
MKDNAQETLVNYDGNARPGELVVNLTVDPPTLYVGNNLGQLTAISGGGGGSTTWALLGDKNNAAGPTIIALGQDAGNTTAQGANAIAIGVNAGTNSQLDITVAIGADAGANNQQYASIAIGSQAGQNDQQDFSVAIGSVISLTKNLEFYFLNEKLIPPRRMLERLCKSTPRSR